MKENQTYEDRLKKYEEILDNVNCLHSLYDKENPDFPNSDDTP